MRKRDKEQLENFIPLFREAHRNIGDSINEGKNDVALQLLTDCQTCAVSMGTMIEELEGEGKPVVAVLEEYCEFLYQIYQSVCDDTSCGGKCVAELNEYTKCIEETLFEDIIIKREVVFCPYNSSMWDSLESVYLAATEDENTDVYVVPVPYYDRDSKGNFKDMHYDGDKLPSYVKVTHYDEYDFAGRHPDIIFIHNPYDEANYVTSVHPFFYSKNLKQYTDKLVYIPYFVLDEVNPRNTAALAGLENFVLVPAVIHAHTVIVQSESMRQAYINIMVGQMGEKTRKYWEEKVLGLGSPKFDKAKKARETICDIPLDWEKVICKEDGSRKKVVFYNTSVVAMLNYKDLMLKKIKKVHKIFKEKNDDVALIWRPHPLLRATIESMRCDLLKEYDEIVDAYINGGWGIYDVTPNLDLVLNLSDAYYGDHSSVVELCREVGIPVLIQDPYI